MLCDNAWLKHAIINPRCHDNEIERVVIIRYTEMESDTLYLCSDCARAVTKDARRGGYKVTNRRW